MDFFRVKEAKINGGQNPIISFMFQGLVTTMVMLSSSASTPEGVYLRVTFTVPFPFIVSRPLLLVLLMVAGTGSAFELLITDHSVSAFVVILAVEPSL